MDLDHLAVAGESLGAAVAHVEEALGVSLQTGGQHGVFGTHNYLLGLADGLYLEAIAIDPDTEPQRSPRWFDLDRFSGAPRISNWICRCSDMPGVLSQLPVGVGSPVSLTRGDLRWDMAVPADGILPYDNMFPALIEWHSDHPAPLLKQKGCTLERLVVSHPEAAAMRIQLPIQDSRVVFESGAAGYEAHFGTPHGRRVLR